MLAETSDLPSRSALSPLITTFLLLLMLRNRFYFLSLLNEHQCHMSFSDDFFSVVEFLFFQALDQVEEEVNALAECCDR